MRTGIMLLGVFALVLPVSSFAAPDQTGHFAVGYFNPDAPLGGRYQITPGTALDLAFGFEQDVIGDDPSTATPGDDKKNLALRMEAGLPLRLVQRERVNFFVRPGVLLEFVPTYHRATPADVYEKKTETDLRVSGILGAEWFAADDLSFSVGEGVEIVSSKGVFPNELTTGAVESTTTINGLQALDITRIGFHFYF